MSDFFFRRSVPANLGIFFLESASDPTTFVSEIREKSGHFQKMWLMKMCLADLDLLGRLIILNLQEQLPLENCVALKIQRILFSTTGKSKLCKVMIILIMLNIKFFKKNLQVNELIDLL